jgi:small subunit ribosomal protein S10|nr:ribosomal protein S10 [Meringosphaera mediterranea]WLD06276.1 ribosomal protein S10 [Meringosphaera mediterranea]
MQKNIRINLESFNSKLINQALAQITKTVTEEKGSVIGVRLPTKKRIYCLLRSPHVNKDSREHFEIRRYKIIVDISTQVENPLVNLLIPAGVTATIRE